MHVVACATLRNTELEDSTVFVTRDKQAFPLSGGRHYLIPQGCGWQAHPQEKSCSSLPPWHNQQGHARTLRERLAKVRGYLSGGGSMREERKNTLSGRKQGPVIRFSVTILPRNLEWLKISVGLILLPERISLSVCLSIYLLSSISHLFSIYLSSIHPSNIKRYKN